MGEDEIFMQIRSDGKKQEVLLFNKSADDRRKARELRARKQKIKDKRKAKREKRERSKKESHRQKNPKEAE